MALLLNRPPDVRTNHGNSGGVGWRVTHAVALQVPTEGDASELEEPGPLYSRNAGPSNELKCFGNQGKRHLIIPIIAHAIHGGLPLDSDSPDLIHRRPQPVKF
jgi:hypothetical protein